MTDSSSILNAESHAPVPWWSDIRVLRRLFQLVVLLIVLAIILYLAINLLQSLNDLGLNLSFEFLNRRAGFGISEGPDFTSDQSMWEAYAVGIVNTLRAVGMGIVLATVVGTAAGIARLSRNWLVSRLALAYVEITQNIPLLVQLFFWLTLIQTLPRLRRDEVFAFPAASVTIGPIEIPPVAYLSQRGLALPGIALTETFARWWPALLLGLIAGFAAWKLAALLRARQGRPPVSHFGPALAGFLIVLAAGWAILAAPPIQIVIPVLSGDGVIINYLGGWVISPNMQVLLLGLVLYTGGFIAEAVRAGIQSIPYGQIEAATSLGLGRGEQLRLIILPQALRVIIPPLINQYLNLAKNSSLAIAVAFPDLFNISQTIGNQTGQNIQVVALVMGTYLVMSLLISFVLNYINRRIQIVER